MNSRQRRTRRRKAVHQATQLGHALKGTLFAYEGGAHPLLIIVETDPNMNGFQDYTWGRTDGDYSHFESMAPSRDLLQWFSECTRYWPPGTLGGME